MVKTQHSFFYFNLIFISYLKIIWKCLVEYIYKLMIFLKIFRTLILKELEYEMHTMLIGNILSKTSHNFF